jgi:hypothetical protein
LHLKELFDKRVDYVWMCNRGHMTHAFDLFYPYAWQHCRH